jgi:fructokinase
MSHIWGIDLGGTKIEGVVLDPAHPDQPLCRLRVPTEAENGYEHIRGQFSRLVKSMVEKTGLPLPNKIGLGSPGVIDPQTQKLKNSNTRCFNGKPLGDDFSESIGTELVLANDANCLALAEATLGAGRGFPTVFGIILGTGVGGGIVVDRKVLAGCHGIAGEWGQLVLDPNGPVSVYGTRGTVEAFISGPALERFYAERSGEKRQLKDIAARAEAGEIDAVATIDRLTTYFAQALGYVINVLDPHAVIIGGGVGNIDALYTKATRAKITANIFNPTFEGAVLKPILGDSGGVFGAAMLVA